MITSSSRAIFLLFPYVFNTIKAIKPIPLADSFVKEPSSSKSCKLSQNMYNNSIGLILTVISLLLAFTLEVNDAALFLVELRVAPSPSSSESFSSPLEDELEFDSCSGTGLEFSYSCIKVAMNLSVSVVLYMIKKSLGLYLYFNFSTKSLNPASFISFLKTVPIMSFIALSEESSLCKVVLYFVLLYLTPFCAFPFPSPT